MTERHEALPDVLRLGLDLVICGTASGKRSALVGAYYAHGSNCFWKILHETGLTPHTLAPREFRKLLEFDIGLTDLAKHHSGPDSGIKNNDYDVSGFRKKIVSIQPQVLMFNGKTAASKYFRTSTGKLKYGLQKERIDATVLFVAPSTSGSARRYWTPDPWRDCASLIQGLRRGRKF